MRSTPASPPFAPGPQQPYAPAFPIRGSEPVRLGRQFRHKYETEQLNNLSRVSGDSTASCPKRPELRQIRSMRTVRNHRMPPPNGRGFRLIE